MPTDHSHIDNLTVMCKKLERGECAGDEPCGFVEKLLDLGGPRVQCEPANTPIWVWGEE